MSRNVDPIDLQDWELAALANMLLRVDPITGAEKWMRGRVLDKHVRDNLGGDPR